MEALAGGGFGESEEMRGSTRLRDGQFSPALALLGVWNGAKIWLDLAPCRCAPRAKLSQGS